MRKGSRASIYITRLINYFGSEGLDECTKAVVGVDAENSPFVREM